MHENKKDQTLKTEIRLGFGADEILTPEDEKFLSGLPPIEFPWGKTPLPPDDLKR